MSLSSQYYNHWKTNPNSYRKTNCRKILEYGGVGRVKVYEKGLLEFLYKSKNVEKKSTRENKIAEEAQIKYVQKKTP